MSDYPRYLRVRVDTEEQDAAVARLFAGRFWFRFNGHAWVADDESQSWGSLFDYAWNGERPNQRD